MLLISRMLSPLRVQRSSIRTERRLVASEFAHRGLALIDSGLQIRGNLSKLVERGLEVFGNLGGDHIRIRQISRILKAFVFQPEDIQVDLVTL